MAKARQTALENLKNHLGAIAEFDAEQPVEGNDLGAINFEAGRGLFSDAIKLARETDVLAAATIALAFLLLFLLPMTTKTAPDASDTASTFGKIIALAMSDANALQRRVNCLQTHDLQAG